ncbi:MAG: energy-coupling factor transporter transmembrane protein EcfT, partial [Patescibacteria group bacterium]|nr:energy-coupling factor transporter transmembrane protein EcfT [Patescibacteria group bacterium]
YVLSSAIFILLAYLVFLLSGTQVLYRLKPMLYVFILILAIQIFLNSHGSLSIRIFQGLSAWLKLTTLSLLMLAYTAVSSVSEIARVLSFLPRKIQLMLTITLSLIPVIFKEAQKIYMAQNSRGYNTKSLNMIKNTFPIVIPLLHRILHRSEQIAMIMQSRGFNDE